MSRPTSARDASVTKVEFWEVVVGHVDSEAAEDMSLLDDVERNRAARYHFDADRQLFVACRAALRRVVGQRLGLRPRAVPLATDALGKPFVVNAEFHFNVSHSSARGLIAVSPMPVGVDIERLRPVPDARGVAERFFTPGERAAVFDRRSPESADRRFLKCWTLKEALLKARGVGLTAPLTDFSVDFDLDPPRLTWERTSAGHDEPEWALSSLPTTDDYLGAVAVQATAIRLEARALPRAEPAS